MKKPPRQTVLVILTGAAVPPGLARAAVRNGWPILDGPLDPSELRLTQSMENTGVAMIHIPIPHATALGMIRGFRDASRSTVVAVGAADSEHDEVVTRAAGASVFLPESADADLIESTVRALMAPAVRSQRPGHCPSGPASARLHATPVETTHA